jgi:CheY-like chemotaxis protein
VLQTLSAGLQVLRHGASEKQQEMLASCLRAVSRGGELARKLMAFGRVQEVRSETIDTAERLREGRHLLGGALPADIALEYDLAPELWPVTVDPAQLELALLNLVINARDAMPGGGRIVLHGSNHVVGTDRTELPAGEYVLLAISDTGHGMSEEVMARALDPFYTTKGVGKGSGMGLPQAYGFARQNGGTLLLESRPGKGTTVRMSDLRASKGRVLLVEDDDDVRDTVSNALRAAGFDIHTAATGDEARQRMDAGEHYDAVLTDIVMPGQLSGLDLAAHIRARFPRTGVVLATGYTDRAVHLPGVKALPKPYGLQQAVEALNAAIQK